MSAKESSGKESSAGQKSRDVGRPAKEAAHLETPQSAGDAWQRAANRPDLLAPADLLLLQNTLGNALVQRLLDRSSTAVQRTPTAPTPSSLASTPGGQAAALPATVQTAYQARITANDLLGALNVVVQHMGSAGEIDLDLLRTEANPESRQAICQGADCFRLSTTGGAYTHDCQEIVSGETRLPNPRIEVHEDVIRNPIRLQSTLAHEYRHVRQQFALINNRGSASASLGHCLGCNNPEEMDAYLTEVEQGYDPLTMVNAFARAYVIWGYLAPEQQAVFRARKTAAEAKIARHYPGMAWDANGEVIAYRRRSEGLITAHESRLGRARPFYCSSSMAPLNAGTPTEGAATGGSASSG